MRKELQQITRGFSRKGKHASDMEEFLNLHNDSFTARHCLIVAEEARGLAQRFGENPESAYIAGLYHDVSAIIPKPERAEFARSLGIEVFPEEDIFPMIVHQKISVVMAREIFGVNDEGILGAIGCHTTLKAGATRLDKVVFVADKVRWDQDGIPPYYDELQEAMEESLDAAAFLYISYLWERRSSLPIMHRWLEEAYYDLRRAEVVSGQVIGSSIS